MHYYIVYNIRMYIHVFVQKSRVYKNLYTPGAAAQEGQGGPSPPNFSGGGASPHSRQTNVIRALCWPTTILQCQLATVPAT